MKMIRKSTTGINVICPVTANHPIIGGKAPAPPPITMFNGVRGFSHTV